MPYTDKDKSRKYNREHIAKKKNDNPIWNIELKKRVKQKRATIHDITDHIKNIIGCLLCDERNPNKLQFHHVIPEFKVAPVSHLISRGCKLILVLKEIDKCVCVCTSCHKLLQDNIYFINGTIRKEKWYNDWGINEALEWINFHPQSRIKKNHCFEVIKAVVRNSQIQDNKKFKGIKF